MKGTRTMLGLAAAVAAALAAPTTARAQIPFSCGFASSAVGAIQVSPMVQVCVNGELYSFTAFRQVGKLLVMPTQTVNLAPGALFTVGASYDPDPSVVFTFGSVLPAGFGPLTFDAYFTTPVVGGPYNTASSSGTLGVTATGVLGAATGQVTNGTYPTYISGYADLMNLGVDTGTGTCTVSTPPSPNSTSCNPPGATNTIAPISPTFLTARLSYTHETLGVGASSASFTGAVDLTASAVPEPATIGLLAAGLLVIGGAAARRRREG